MTISISPISPSTSIPDELRLRLLRHGIDIDLEPGTMSNRYFNCWHPKHQAQADWRKSVDAAIGIAAGGNMRKELERK